MQENIDTMIYEIASVLGVPYETIAEVCQEICSKHPVPSSETLQVIHIKAMAGMTIDKISHDLLPEVLSRQEQFEREVRIIRTLYDAQLITSQESAQKLDEISEEYKDLISR